MTFSAFFKTEAFGKILCVGDIMLDAFVYGVAERLSPEAPIPVFQAQKEERVLGGAGNVMRNICELKGHVVGVCLLGRDEPGKFIQHLALQTENFTLKAFEQDCQTPFKTRYIASNQQLLRVDKEQPLSLSDSTLELMKQTIQKELPSCQVMVLSDYGKGTLSKELLSYCIQEAKSQNKSIIIDPKGACYEKYKGATVLSPNLKEFQQAVQKAVTETTDIVLEARGLLKKLDLKALLITRGAQGMTLVTQEEAVTAEALAKEVYDVSGAGDTVIATLSLALAKGLSLVEAMELSNIAASVVVAKVGTATLTPQELQNALEQSELQLSQQKIMTQQNLLNLRLKWKRQGLKVGFTNGCFDLLHVGHLHTFQEAKKYCDRLIVALNTDESVKRLKGDFRPIQPQEVRSEVLSALSNVDGVILFNDETPLDLIKSLTPDYLFKGADYTKDQVVGGKVVESYGGKVQLISLKEGFSTTRTVSKILKQDKDCLQQKESVQKNSF